MPNVIKTITFKTGRIYDFEQEIVATSYDDGVVTFADASRRIEGEFMVVNENLRPLISEKTIMGRYDRGEYDSTRRSSNDVAIGGPNRTPEWRTASLAVHE